MIERGRRLSRPGLAALALALLACAPSRATGPRAPESDGPAGGPEPAAPESSAPVSSSAATGDAGQVGATADGSPGAGAAATAPPEPPREADHYALETLPTPDGAVLEVSALTVWRGDRVLVGTRRGEVWVADGVLDDEPGCTWTRLRTGLQEPLGFLVEHDQAVLVIQRGELTRLVDLDGDARFERDETVCDRWVVGGNYHEYNFGPVRGPEGDLWITTNRAFGGQPFGNPKWRGFALRITADGEMVPECSGLRSPAGLTAAPWGDLFYTDNQGEWCGASKLSQLVPGRFYGHPFGIWACEDPLWTHDVPADPPNGVRMPEAARTVPNFQLPAVWFPYDKVGRSPAGFVWDTSGGAFGPFEGHLMVTDQFSAEVLRVSLEQVEGHWQGAVYPFRRGLACGAIRCALAPDGTLLIGETDRGWASRGRATFGLERLSFTGRVPAELHTLSATPDGFELRFTVPLDRARAAEAARYRWESYTYLLHSSYGSDEVDRQVPTVREVQVSEDGRTVRLRMDGLREGHVHELHLDDLRTADGGALLHDRAYYTLIRRPGTPPPGAPAER